MFSEPNLNNEEDESDGEMELGEASEILCLFCTNHFASVEEALCHCKADHDFDLNTLQQKFRMDCYSYIKLINFIRSHNPRPEDVMNMSECYFDKDIYMKTVLEDEWLWFDFETEIAEQMPPKPDQAKTEPSSPKTYHANVENGLVTLAQSHFSELQRTIHSLTAQLNESQSYLKMAKDDMKKMQDGMKKLVESSSTERTNQIVNCVSKVALEDDEGYFSTYAHYGIHHEMLSDRVRTETYRDAILNNKSIFKDKVVLDLGCGTGILSMFCATAGAKKVFAIDQSDIIYNAIDIIHENNLQDVIKPIKGKLEETNLEEKVDIIVSEWMGYFLLFEGMLDSVIYARDRYLKPGGLLLPNVCKIYIVASGDTDAHNKLINYWSDVYGYKMNCMKSEVVKEVIVDVANSKHLISEPVVIKEIGIMTCKIDTMDFTSQFELHITKNGQIASLVGYFDTIFQDIPNNVSFSTGPHTQQTHWKQTIFYFKNCKDVKCGDIVRGEIKCSRQVSDVRALSVQIDIFGENHKYILN